MVAIGVSLGQIIVFKKMLLCQNKQQDDHNN
jgi:hypothetical protein